MAFFFFFYKRNLYGAQSVTSVSPCLYGINRGSYMSAHVLLSL